MGRFWEKFPWFMLVLLVSVPLWLRNEYFLRVAVVVVLYALLASSLNVINGYSGLFNIGHAAFYCVGAYTAAILSKKFGLSFWLLLPLSGTASALLSFLLGFPTLRLRGIYFAMTTLGFSEIIRLVVLNWTSLTRGPMGIPGIPFPSFLGWQLRSNVHFYYVILATTALMVFLTGRVLNSRVGRAWIAIREDEMAARAMGIEVFKYRLLNLAFGAFWAGVAGCFYAFFASFISPDSFTLDEGFSILAMVILGGQGTLVGPILGATLLTVLSEIFRGIAQYRLIIFGIAILLTVHLRPQGIAGNVVFSWRRDNLLSSKRAPLLAEGADYHVTPS
jgi:branched-chain amino acid transport system permease protein